jgi:hypothetical protein
MNITGTLKAVFDTKQVSATFSTREFVIETPEQYPQTILFQLVQDKCDLIDSYAEGEEIVVDFNIRGKSWSNPQGEVKYFNTLQAWKLSRPKNESAATNEFAPPTQSAGDQFLNMNNEPKEFENFNSNDEDNEVDPLPF